VSGCVPISLHLSSRHRDSDLYRLHHVEQAGVRRHIASAPALWSRFHDSFFSSLEVQLGGSCQQSVCKSFTTSCVLSWFTVTRVSIYKPTHANSCAHLTVNSGRPSPGLARSDVQLSPRQPHAAEPQDSPTPTHTCTPAHLDTHPEAYVCTSPERAIFYRAVPAHRLTGDARVLAGRRRTVNVMRDANGMT
jgi:hypothetical protein